jgi:hypothetical protein
LKPGRNKDHNPKDRDDEHHQSAECCALIHTSKLEKEVRRVADLPWRVGLSVPRVFLGWNLFS